MLLQTAVKCPSETVLLAARSGLRTRCRRKVGVTQAPRSLDIATRHLITWKVGFSTVVLMMLIHAINLIQRQFTGFEIAASRA